MLLALTKNSDISKPLLSCSEELSRFLALSTGRPSFRRFLFSTATNLSECMHFTEVPHLTLTSWGEKVLLITSFHLRKSFLCRWGCLKWTSCSDTKSVGLFPSREGGSDWWLIRAEQGAEAKQRSTYSGFTVWWMMRWETLPTHIHLFLSVWVWYPSLCNTTETTTVRYLCHYQAKSSPHKKNVV